MLKNLEAEMMALLLACSAGPNTQAMPSGEWILEGSGYTGSLEVREDACSIELWGPTLQAGADEVPCQSVREEEGYSLYFGIEMGAGEAAAYAKIDSGLERMTLPLGSRTGDFEHHLTLRAGELQDERREAARRKAAAGLEKSRKMWEESVFQLQDGGVLVGELFFPSERPPEVQLYSAIWMTRGRVPAKLVERGPDLWLSFEIMPSLQSEEGLALVNRAENRVVFPMGEAPVPGEIVLALEPGAVTEAERRAAIDLALEKSLEIEQSLTVPVIDALWARLEDEGCRSWEAMASETPEWGIAMQGYAVDVLQSPEGCRLQVEPRPPQHGRSLAFRAESGGEVQSVQRGFFRR